ncbi:PAS domain-containing hybrid sensor histidine kinase/response regulator [Nostoc sp. MG11]|uniref:PAS domain-containing hybrid sensor histidine kinase/response regulator n=1 Tax=Nostoc sp. MG11 TaxID=2721166 RepID=UPI001865B1C4|nr:PAS domain-containing hybrid sensor histidine kinase/response regulator [Nostoc sp. MG11]
MKDDEFDLLCLNLPNLEIRVEERTAELSHLNTLLQQEICGDRHQVEVALRESEERFRSLKTSSLIGLWQTDSQGRCLYTNAQWPDIFGLTLEQSLGHGWIGAIHPWDRQIVSANWEACIHENREFSQEFRLLTPQREVHWVQAQAAAVYSATGEILGYVGTVEDISDRKHTEISLQKQIEQKRLVIKTIQRIRQSLNLNEILNNTVVVNQGATAQRSHPGEIDLLQQLATQVSIAIQESEVCEQVQAELMKFKRAKQRIRKQAALLNITTDAIIVCTLQQRILFWNQGAERLYGFSAVEAIGQNVNELFDQEILPQLEEAEKTIVERGSWQGELSKQTKSGKEVIVASRLTLMRDEAEQPKSILIVDTDITEKKQLEAQFLRTQHFESISTLASGIAHNLNNILTPILSSSEMLALRLPNLDAQNQQLLDILEQNSKRAADLVKQILMFAHVSEVKGVTLQIEYLLLEIEQIVNSTFPKSIKISKNLPKQNLWTIKADPNQMHQVLMNLCVNARDAMPKGGTLYISAENLFVDENFAKLNLDAQVGSYIAITISDTGFGIPPLILEQIFEPFFTTKEVGKGTGLGLSTVLSTVKNHGGFINVESEVGKGSKFQVYLPAVKEKTRQQTEKLKLLNGNGELILVVDDEAAILEISKTLLEDYNYKILTASNGIEAIALYAQHKNQVSLVLMDIMMPAMDGLTAICILQQMNPQVKIIGVSGVGLNSQLVEVTSAGINVLVKKPYTLHELLHAIYNVLSEP